MWWSSAKRSILLSVSHLCHTIALFHETVSLFYLFIFTFFREVVF